MKTKHVRLSRPGSNPARESQLRIEGAMATLSKTERGRSTIDDLALIFNGQARNLSSDEMSALVLLVREFAFGGRRDFLKLKEEKAGEHVGLFNVDVMIWITAAESYRRRGIKLQLIKGCILAGEDGFVARFASDEHARQVLFDAGYANSATNKNIFEPHP